MKKIIQLFFLLLFTFTVVAQDTSNKSSAGGPATAKELVGFWKMIPLPNPSVNKVNPWPQPYQWFEFTEDGKVYSMMVSSNKEYSKQELRKAFDVFPKKRVPNYKMYGAFVIIDNPEIKNYLEIWGTNIFAKNIDGIAQKGDLMLTLDDGT